MFQASKHQAELSHEAMSGAAAFFAAREYEKHVEKNGHPPNHAVAKELLYVTIHQPSTKSHDANYTD